MYLKFFAVLLLGIILGVDAAYDWDRWISLPLAPAAAAAIAELLELW